MDLTTRIKELCDSKKVTFAEVERSIGLSNGQIRRWDKVSPRTSTLEKVADYFQVSIDFLLSRTSIPNYHTLNEVAEQNNIDYPGSGEQIDKQSFDHMMDYTIEQKLEALIHSLSSDEKVVFSINNAPLEEENKKILLLSLDHSLKLGKTLAKSNTKFT